MGLVTRPAHKHQVKEKHDPKAEKWQVVFFFFGLYNEQEQEKLF
jgi:hypothetical protein